MKNNIFCSPSLRGITTDPAWVFPNEVNVLFSTFHYDKCKQMKLYFLLFYQNHETPRTKMWVQTGRKRFSLKSFFFLNNLSHVGFPKNQESFGFQCCVLHRAVVRSVHCREGCWSEVVSMDFRRRGKKKEWFLGCKVNINGKNVVKSLNQESVN